MKYWKGKIGTPKEGQCGTYDDNGTVPDSDPVTMAEYDAWVAALPSPTPTQLQIDIGNMILTVGNVKVILERMRKGEK
jgi:hypothetical protein